MKNLSSLIFNDIGGAIINFAGLHRPSMVHDAGVSRPCKSDTPPTVVKVLSTLSSSPENLYSL
jgi:hypothetical protein